MGTLRCFMGVLAVIALLLPAGRAAAGSNGQGQNGNGDLQQPRGFANAGGYLGLGDLNVMIEVRFIMLAEQFLERLGVDFDFDISGSETNGQDPNGPEVRNGFFFILGNALKALENLDPAKIPVGGEHRHAKRPAGYLARHQRDSGPGVSRQDGEYRVP